MSNQTLILMTAAVVVGALILLALNLSSHLNFSSNDVYIKPGDVRGSAVEHAGKLYTLNFEQQNRLLDGLNRAVPVKMEAYKNRPNNTNISKIVIYRFNLPDIEITPIMFEGDNFVFYAPAWNQSFYLMGLSGGDIRSLLSEAYD